MTSRPPRAARAIFAQRGSTAEEGSKSIPWTADEFLRLGTITLIGLVGIFTAWYLASGDASESRQIGPLDLAVAAVVLSGVANAGWLLRGRRAIGERRRALLGDAPLPGHAVARAHLQPSVIDDTVLTDDTLYVAGPERDLFHRSDCQLAVGRDWPASSVPEHLSAGRRPCGVCRP